ncbi:MAG: glycosyltransferase, partial [Candidatus Acidiferrum sp.]
MATKNILMVAFQFPPMSGSSGLLRVLKFCKYLPEFGWTPTVVTAKPRMYEQVNEQQLALIPKGLEVIRAFGMDAKRHLSLLGRYPRFVALPDTSASWSMAAIPAALRAIRRKKIDVVFTTFPVATAIWIGLVLHRLTGKPWIVDFRDSMTEGNYPRDRTTWKVWRWLEGQAVRRASLILFTARSAIRMYRQRYPELVEEKCLLLPNRYDEEDFASFPATFAAMPQVGCAFQLLHSGLVYPEERDPQPLFRALARLKGEGKISAETLQVNFRAPGFEETYAKKIHELGLGEIVKLLPRIPYKQALEEYWASDALL